MAGLNDWSITGNLTRDPELRQTQGGHQVCNMGVAVNGWKQDDVLFVDVSVWGKTAEACAAHLTKGAQVGCTGRAKLRTWEKQDGTTGAAIQMEARDVAFLGSPNRNGNGGGQQQTQTTPPAQPAAQPAQQAQGDDDIPF